MKNATRERSRVRLLRSGFMDLQRALPCIPPDTKLGELIELIIVVTELVLGVSLFILLYTKSGVLIERKLS